MPYSTPWNYQRRLSPALSSSQPTAAESFLHYAEPQQSWAENVYQQVLHNVIKTSESILEPY